MLMSIFDPCEIKKENTSACLYSIATKSGYVANLIPLIRSLTGVNLDEEPMSISSSAFTLLWAPIKHRNKLIKHEQITEILGYTRDSIFFFLIYLTNIVQAH